MAIATSLLMEGGPKAGVAPVALGAMLNMLAGPLFAMGYLSAITFLATPASQGITGTTLRVCGGAFVGR